MFRYNYNGKLQDYLTLDVYEVIYNGWKSGRMIDIAVRYNQGVLFEKESSPWRRFNLNDGTLSESPCQGNSFLIFSKREIAEIKALLVENRKCFTFENCFQFSQRPSHYRVLEEKSELYKEIVTHFNKEHSWRMNSLLWRFANEVERHLCTREFVKDALEWSVWNETEIQEVIEMDQYDLFTYDNPPNPDEYWAEYKRVYPISDLGLEDIVLYEVEGLEGMYCLECRVPGEYRNEVVNQHLIKEDGVFRPFNLPDWFYSADLCSYIQ